MKYIYGEITKLVTSVQGRNKRYSLRHCAPIYIALNRDKCNRTPVLLRFRSGDSTRLSPTKR